MPKRGRKSLTGRQAQYLNSLSGRPRKKRRTTTYTSRGYTRRVGNYGRYGSRAGQHQELKFHDVDLDDAVVAAAGTIADSINKIGQGTTEITRIGRKVWIRKIQWRYRVILPTTDATSIAQNPDNCRIILFKDRQCNGAAALVTDILESADFQSFNNLVNSGRFQVLMDKNIVLNPRAIASDGTGLMSTAEVDVQGTFFKNCNIPLEFNSTAGAITEICCNNLGVLLISRAGLCGFSSKIRLRFDG